MARLPRYVFPGQPQHVIQRGNNRTPIFVLQSDYFFFRSWLTAACKRYRCSVHAYVLMTNHVHLLITPLSASGIGKVMQSVGRRYVRYFNDTHGRTGSLWEGRYRATLVDSNRYLLACYHYIELNPVRSGQVDHPREYPWSSYRANAFGRHDPLVSPHDVYLALGGQPEHRYVAYRALFADALDEPAITRIRESTNKGWALGSDRYRTVITNMSNRRANPLPRGGYRRATPWALS